MFRPSVVSRIVALATIVSLAAMAMLVPGALARNAYLLGYEENLVAVFDANTLQFGPLTPTGSASEPFTLAISQDGGTVWVLSYTGGTLASLSTSSGQFVGTPIPVSVHSYGIGISPTANRAYIANNGSESVEAIDLNTRTQVGGDIPVGEDPNAVSITPNGARVYVSNEESENVSVIDTANDQVIATVPLGGAPYGSAVTPDGRFVFFATSTGIFTIETASNQVAGSPILPGLGFQQVAISPDGSHLYATSQFPGGVSVIDVPTRQPLTTIPVGEGAEFLALTSDGRRLLVEQPEPGQVTPIDTSTNQAGVPAPFGQEYLGQLAIVPDRSPSSGIVTPGKARPGVPITIDGSSSTDPDGKVSSWAWTFGDGQGATVSTPTVAHTYAKPGKYSLALKVTDNEGCGEATVFTGTTAYCSGQSPAHLPEPAVLRLAPVVTVAYPGVKLACPKSAKGGCKFKLKAVQRKKKGKLKALSTVSTVKAKAGKKVVVSLKPKPNFARKLAGATKILVQQKTTAGGVTTVKVKKLTVVQ